MDTKNTPLTWISFIGVIFLLLGIYASFRVILNLTMFAEYPTSGVLSVLPGTTPPFYGPREEDCKMMIPPPAPIPGDTTSMKDFAIQKQSCFDSVKVAQEQAKVNDISQSALFLFLGAGVLYSRKRFFS